MLKQLHETQGFDALFSHEETGSGITYSRDRAVQLWANRTGIVWHQATQNGVIRGLQSRDHRMPVIRERLMNTLPKPPPVNISDWLADSTGSGAFIRKLHAANSSGKTGNIEVVEGTWPCFSTLSGQPLDTRISEDDTQQLTEHHARADLHSFLHERAVHYSGGISSPNTAFKAGSRLSAHLAWGTLSLRQVFDATRQRDQELAGQSGAHVAQWRKSLKAFQSRLHWHDHFIQRLESAPDMEFQALNPAYQKLDYGDDERLLRAWVQGQTGLPLIDACMRCLAATGFLNFRMRAMVVSAACFGLAQSWRSLQYPLARLFLDYEPGIHFSQIQMQAGIVGINTLRVYSPHKQLLDQDPQAVFVKRWIPELREFDALQISQYNERTLGDYPEPVTDIKQNTRIIRDQVYAIRKSEAGQEASADVLEKHGSRLPGNDRTRRKSVGRKTLKRKQTEGEADGRRASQASKVSAQMTLDLDD